MNRVLAWRHTAVLLLLLFTFMHLPWSLAAHSPAAQADATPTPDRLAAPPTVAAPTMADDGAQLYWLHCQPCHGDRGQGLTDAPDDDWRAQYPPEEQFCWNSGCHGERPYENGFIVPRTVPALIGEGSLANYPTMHEVYVFMRAAMPRQVPGSLTDAEYLAITAFLARAHDLSDGVALAEADLSTIILNPAYMEVTADNAGGTAVPSTPVAPSPEPAAVPARTEWLAVGLVILLLFLGGALWLRHGR
ncbi:MAG: c-type cytochrome [Anaerolineae bacterium]|nr:c-type cytochrome [Anaerolineae bacterium]